MHPIDMFSTVKCAHDGILLLSAADFLFCPFTPSVGDKNTNLTTLAVGLCANQETDLIVKILQNSYPEELIDTTNLHFWPHPKY